MYDTARPSARLEEVRERLIRWRERHGGRGRPIPEELWLEAAAVAAAQGVSATARALGVDRERLARRVSETPQRVEGGSRSPAPAFIELPRSQSPVFGQRIVRFTRPDGEQMEIAGDIDVVSLVREFWDRAR